MLFSPSDVFTLPFIPSHQGRGDFRIPRRLCGGEVHFARSGAEETKRRCLWGLRRLSDELKRVVAGFEYTDRELDALLKGCIAECNLTKFNNFYMFNDHEAT